MEVNISQKKLGISIGADRVVGSDHSALDNLDFDRSGHTGFQRAGNYVEQEQGKGLSSNDFSNAYKSVLDNLDNVIEQLQEKITPANKLESDLVDDTNQTNKLVTAAEKTQIVTNASNISAIKDGVNIDSFGDVETALLGKVDTSAVGANNGIATLNSSGKIPNTQLPDSMGSYFGYDSTNQRLVIDTMEDGNEVEF